jgi:hypothetical protein
MFFFGAAALVCWARKFTAASAALFALALLSKESAVVFLPLFLLVSASRDWKRLWPHAVLCALAVVSITQSRSNSFRFSDGSFSLAAPFWITLPVSLSRLLWIWGWPALLAVFASPSTRELRRAGLTALAWMAIALLPYSFLTYSTRIPSRQTYLASAGLAMLVGLAAAHLASTLDKAGEPRTRPALLAALLAIVLAHNVLYLWTKKRAQFQERAAPTDQLIAIARSTSAPIFVECFPLPRIVAEEAVRLAANRPPESLLWPTGSTPVPSGAVPFCYRGPQTHPDFAVK